MGCIVVLDVLLVILHSVGCVTFVLTIALHPAFPFFSSVSMASSNRASHSISSLCSC